MRKLFKSLSVRIGAIFSIFTIIILAIMGAVINHLVTLHYYEMDNQILHAKIARVEELLVKDPDNSIVMANRLKSYFDIPRRVILKVERPIGTTIYSTEGVNFPTQTFFDQGQMGALQEWQDGQMHYHVVWRSQASDPESSNSFRIITGIERNYHVRFLNMFHRLLYVVGIIGTIVLMLLGWYAAWRGLRPIQSMAYLAESITAHHLSERLDIEKTPTELTSLAVSFNEMLDRLKFAFTRLSDFSSDLAHEFRAPINNVMTQTQVCLSKPRDNQEYRNVLYSNVEELQRLSRMISDMLLLAEADHGTNVLYTNKFYFGEELNKLCDFYQVLADEKGMKLILNGDAEMHGDKQMLLRAFSNLITNAIHYGLEQTEILIQIMRQQDTTIITIQNQTKPIPPEQLERFFDRFYRADRSRVRTDGTGLGLAITKSIVEMHGGEIKVSSEKKLVTFTLLF